MKFWVFCQWFPVGVPVELDAGLQVYAPFGDPLLQLLQSDRPIFFSVSAEDAIHESVPFVGLRELIR